MQKIIPFLWFNDNAEASVKFYASVFKKVKVTRVARYSKSASTASGRPKDSVMTIAFKMFGQEFVALNGGPHFKFNEAVSFVVNCRTQKEIDYYWKKLSAGGHEGQCGWPRTSSASPGRWRRSRLKNGSAARTRPGPSESCKWSCG